MKNKFSQAENHEEDESENKNKFDQILKNFTDKIPEIYCEEILLKHGLIPLNYSDNQNSYIARGYYAYAFNILYKGKHLVAKITNKIGNFDASLKLYGVKDSLGEQEKHIMKIYDFIEGSEKNHKYEILVCEKLNEADVHIKNYIFNEPNTNQLDFITKNEKENEERFFNFKINNYIKTINIGCKLLQNEDFVGKNFQDPNLTEIFKEIIDNKIKPHLINLTNEKIESLYYGDINIYGIFRKELKEKIKSDTIYNFIIKKIMWLFSYIASRFPSSYLNQNEEEDLVFPETKSLLICLEKLKKLGIKFRDLHDNNIMERNDKTLVISDPGEFEFIN